MGLVPQLRGLGAANTNPTAVKAKNRLRLLLMGAAPLVAAATHDRPGDSGASVPMEEREPSYLSAEALARLDREEPVRPKVPEAPEVSDADVDRLLDQAEDADPREPPEAARPLAPPLAVAARPLAPPEGMDDSDDDDADEPAAAPAIASLSRQGLAYVAGYVAAKCAAVDKTLGRVTSEASAVPRDGRYAWLDAVSRGGLTVPSQRWLGQVEELEVTFVAIHRGGIDRGPGVVRRLAADAALKFPELDSRVLKKYAMTRTQLRAREVQRLYARANSS